MAWRLAMGNFLRSGTTISLFGGIIASGSYVAYKDYARYRRMIKTYSTGNILPPFTDNLYEITYYPRTDIENKLQSIINNDFANEYFLINGEVGVGKSRVILEFVRRMIANEGAQHEGAPIYVLVTQGTSFPESLANAVNFFFDEHISFKFFLDYLVRINSFPQRDSDSKLTRVLDAIEESSFLYMQKYGRPAVLIIDGISSLHGHMSGALEKIQDKAKLWADTNTVKVIFINNDEETEARLQGNSSSWSRAATPMTISDLSHEEAISFLMATPFMETPCHSLKNANCGNDKVMSREHAEKIVDLVGCRVILLIACKRDFVHGVALEDTMEHLKDREREKFIHVSRTPSFWTVVSLLRTAPGKCYKMSKLVKETSQEDIHSLAMHNVVRYERDNVGVLVKFQSVLTESVVDELQNSYLAEKQEGRT